MRAEQRPGLAGIRSVIAHDDADFIPPAVAQYQHDPLQSGDIVDEGMHRALARRVKQTTLTPALAARILRRHPGREDGRTAAIATSGQQGIDLVAQLAVALIGGIRHLLIPHRLPGPVPVATGLGGQQQADGIIQPGLAGIGVLQRMYHVLERGQHRPGVEIGRVGLIVAAEPLHELRIAIVGAAPGAGFDMCRARRIGREAVQIVIHRGQLEAWIALQPLHQLPGVVVVIAVGAAAVVVAIGMQQEERRVLGVEAAGVDDAVVNLAEHVRILQRAEPPPGIFVADIALGGHGDDPVQLAIGVFVLHIFRAQQARRNRRTGPDVAQLQPVIDCWIDLLGAVGRQHAFVDAGVGIILAGAEAVD